MIFQRRNKKTLILGALTLFIALFAGFLFFVWHNNPAQFVLPYLNEKIKSKKINFMLQGGNSSFKWSGWSSPLTLKAQQLTATCENNTTCSLPDISVEMDFWSLFKGDFQPKSVTLKEIKIYNETTILFQGDLSIHKKNDGTDIHLNNVVLYPLALLPEIETGLVLKGTGTFQLKNNKLSGKGYLKTEALEENTFYCPPYFMDPLDIDALEIDFYTEDNSLHIPISLKLDDTARAQAQIQLSNFSEFLFEGANEITTTIDAKAENIAIDSLDALWPEPLSKVPRAWVLENLSDGYVSLATSNISASFHRENGIKIQSLSGDIYPFDVTVTYFGDLPAVEKTSGHCWYTRDKFYIEAEGHVQNINLTSALITIHGLDTKDQTIDLDLSLKGPVAQCLNVIAADPLRLPQKLDLNYQQIEGMADIRVDLHFPLEQDVELSQIDVKTTAKIQEALITTEFKIGDTPLTFKKGDFDLYVDRQNLFLTGSAKLWGIATSIEWEEHFKDIDIPFRRQFHLKNTINHNTLESSFIKGEMDLTTTYTVQPDKKSKLTLAGNLEKTIASLPFLNWKKEEGQSGALDIVITTNGKKNAKFEKSTLTAPNLSFSFSGFFKDGEIEGFQTHNGLVHHHACFLEIKRLKNRGLDISCAFSELNLNPLIKMLPELLPLDKKIDDLTYGDLHFLKISCDHVICGPEYELTDLKADLFFQPEFMVSAEINAQTGPSTAPFSFHMIPINDTQQVFSLKSGNGANLLELFESGYDFDKGDLRIEGVKNDRDPHSPQLNGRLTLTEFDVKKAPLLAQIFSVVSVVGMPGLASGQGVHFNKGQVDFSLDDQRLWMHNFKMHGPSLGISFSGNLKKESLNLDGRVTPFSFFNRTLAHIPLLGRILSGGRTEGVFLGRFSVDGPRQNPKVSVNPFSVFTPGTVQRVIDHLMAQSSPTVEPSKGGDSTGQMPHSPSH